MWTTNTATAAMMLTFMQAVLDQYSKICCQQQSRMLVTVNERGGKLSQAEKNDNSVNDESEKNFISIFYKYSIRLK